MGATLSEEEESEAQSQGGKIQKDLAVMVSKTPKADAKKRRAELASGIKTAEAALLQATIAPLEATISEEEERRRKQSQGGKKPKGPRRSGVQNS